MSEQKKDNWNTIIALSTAAMAVFAAITTLYVGKFSSRTVLLQAQESDQWAYYQAKSIKSHAFELQKEHLELEFSGIKGPNKDFNEKLEKTLASYGESLSRYDAEKKEIKDRAEKLGHDKDISQRRSANFGYALIFLQIAIMLSSISVITKKHQLWYFGLGTSALGILFFLDGFYLFY